MEVNQLVPMIAVARQAGDIVEAIEVAVVLIVAIPFHRSWRTSSS